MKPWLKHRHAGGRCHLLKKSRVLRCQGEPFEETHLECQQTTSTQSRLKSDNWHSFTCNSSPHTLISTLKLILSFLVLPNPSSRAFVSSTCESSYLNRSVGGRSEEGKCWAAPGWDLRNVETFSSSNPPRVKIRSSNPPNFTSREYVCSHWKDGSADRKWLQSYRLIHTCRTKHKTCTHHK